MRTALKCVSIAALLAAGAGQTAIARGPGISGGERATLLKEARSLAARFGDSRPYGIEAVLTTTSKAERLLSTTLPACESSRSCAAWPTYVVAMRGHFICNCPGPPGGKISPGKTLTYFAPAKRPPPMSWSLPIGVGNRYPNLRTVGSPVTLYRGHA
jgi:hypothetical protein